MRKIKTIEEFKKDIAPLLKDYELTYKFFKEGDFGSLNQVEFNSSKIGGNIDFWGGNWLGIFVWDYENEKELLNILLEPHQEEEKNNSFKKLGSILNLM